MAKSITFLAALFLLAVLAVAAYVGITLLRDDDPELATSAPQIPTATPGGAATSPTSLPSSAPTAAAVILPAGVMRFVVDPTQSSATYVVREKLARLPIETDASGTTVDTAGGDVTGELYLTAQGLATSNRSSFRVDLNTLRSDESLRDNFVRSNTLQTNQGNNRYAEFTIESVTGFPGSYIEDTEVVLRLTGSMTIKGVTKQLTFDVKARRKGEFLTATADTTFNMSDFGINPPNVPTARAQDQVRLQVILVTRQAVG
jgi:polyisoprenoid-binding protein YceI